MLSPMDVPRRAIGLPRVSGGAVGPGVGPGVAVAISGGPDSLALAAAAAFVAPKLGIRLSGIVIDHGLQTDSASVASAAASAAKDLGVDTVVVRRIEVSHDSSGPESAARDARYDGIARVAAELGVQYILLGHTRDDQAESVLLGLVRGSGSKSLSGMRELSTRGALTLLRPLLEVPRVDTLASCAALGVTPWMDPHNTDRRFLRSTIRNVVLPRLDADLGPGVPEALARTARLLADDADYLDSEAATTFARMRRYGNQPAAVSIHDPSALSQAPSHEPVHFDRAELAALAPAIRRRVYRLAAATASGASLASTHVDQIDRMVLISNAPTHLDLPGTTVERVRATVSFTATH